MRTAAVLRQARRPAPALTLRSPRGPLAVLLSGPDPHAAMPGWGRAAGVRPAMGVARTILVVDDQHDILDSLKLYLEHALPGVAVVVAPSGRDALELLREHQVDLIITDLRMPEMDGLEFIRTLPKGRDVPVFLMTAYAESELAERARSSGGFEEFLRKPIDPAKLVALVRGYLRG